MKIKVLHSHESEVRAYSKEEFQSRMGVQWLDRLEFSDEGQRLQVEKKTLKLAKKGKIERRQEWLGKMYDRELSSGYSPDLVIKWIDETIGYGVFANEPIFPTAFIGEYTGVVRRKRAFLDRKNNYCFLYPVPFLFKLVIDAEQKGNITRFINHSTDPNLEPLSVYHGGIMHLILIANRPIDKGEQLSYDYGPIYWEKRKKARLLIPAHISRLVNA